MKTSLLPVLAGVLAASLLVAPDSFGRAVSVAEFNRDLREKLGARRNAPATALAASLLRTALTDPANKRNAAAYTRGALAALRPRLAANFLSRSRITLSRSLNIGYFALIRFDARSPQYVTSLRTLVTTLPVGQRTSTLAQQLSNPVVSFARSRGGSVADLNFLRDTIYRAARQEPPPPIS